MLIPVYDGGVTGVTTRWTGAGARMLVDVFLGKASAPTSFKLAALAGNPTFDLTDEVTPEALAVMELDPAAGIPLIPAVGYSRPTVTLSSGFGTAGGLNPVQATSSVEVTFGHNSGTLSWPTVDHIALLSSSGSTVYAVTKLSLPVACAVNYRLRCPVGSLRFLASTSAPDA